MIKGLFWRADYYGASIEGGMTSMQFGLLNALNELGHSSVFASSGKVLLPENVNSYFIPHSKLFRNFPEVLNLPYNYRALKRLEKIIEIEAIDFIYQFQHDFIFSGALAKKKFGLPFFLQCEGVQQWTKANWGKLYLKKHLKLAEEIQWATADHIFTVSEQMKSLLISYGVDRRKITVNSSKVDTNKFRPDIKSNLLRNKYDFNNRFIVAFTGTFAQWHGIEYLAKAIKIVKDKIPDLLVVFIGDGILRNSIEQIIKEDNVENYSLITGIIPFNLMPQYLSECDVFISPGVSPEKTEYFNSPIKLFEYMAMGKPIIVTDIGQQSEVINDKINGLLIPEKDIEAIAEAIEIIYNNKELANKIAVNARKDAVEKYDWKVNAQIIIDNYNYLISK